MDKKDRFAVWIADRLLRANGEDFAAEALGSVAAQAEAVGSLDAALETASSNKKRPGDIGLDMIGPLLPVLLLEVGRRLWDAYTDALFKKTGQSLADLTVDAVKQLGRRTWSDEPLVPIEEVARQIRAAAQRAALDGATTERLVASLRDPATADTILHG